MMRNMVIPTMLKPIDKIKLILYTEFLEARYVLYPAFFDMIFKIDDTFKSVVHAVAIVNVTTP